MLINNDNKSVWAHYYQEAGWEGDEGHGAGASLAPAENGPWKGAVEWGGNQGREGGTEGAGRGQRIWVCPQPGQESSAGFVQNDGDFVTLAGTKDIKGHFRVLSQHLHLGDTSAGGLRGPPGVWHIPEALPLVPPRALVLQDPRTQHGLGGLGTSSCCQTAPS